MLKKNYPYKSKVVLTEKQATKEPVGSYYHPTEKTFRSGACPVGMTLKKGYHRKGYMKMNGTLINNTNVDPVCVKNKGLPGKLIKKEKDDFKEFGYLTSSNNNSRFKSLLEACVVLSYGTVMRKLSALKKKSSKKEDNKSKKLYTIYSSDILMLQKWRIKNPDLYKVKTELLLVGGQYMSGKKLNSEELINIIQNLRNYISNDTPNPFFKSFQKLSNLDVSEIKKTSNLFKDFDFDKAKKLGYNVDISGWKLGNVENMSSMFSGSNFNQDLSSWGPHLVNVKSMEFMFYNCKGFNQDLSSWGPYLGNVESMTSMFSGSNFNKDLSSWKLDKVKTMKFMFFGCINFNQDLSSWKLGNVIDMSGMFYNCINFNQDLSSWKLGNVIDISVMFYGCTKFNQDLSSWGQHLGNVESMGNMFYNCSNFNQNLSSWGQHLGKVRIMSNMFKDCEMFEGNGLDSWGEHLGNVKTMENMFNGCRKFNQDLSSWKLDNVTNMSNMFYNCKSFEGKGLDSWGPHLGNVTNMSYMFYNCEGFNQDLSSWGQYLGNVTNTSNMFNGCKNFKKDLSSWSGYLKVIKYKNMFDSNYNINLKKWQNTNPSININIMKS